MPAPLSPIRAAPTYRTWVGRCEVTALLDGHVDFGLDIFPEAAPATVAAVLACAGARQDGIRAPVTVYAINTGSKLFLVDGGTGAAFGPDLGHLPESLAAAGYAPEQVDGVLVTHLHPDHMFGLVDAAGSATFPNAIVYVHETDHAFWTDNENRTRVEAFMVPVFDGLGPVLAPYADRLRTVADGEAIVPGLTVAPLHGHTPGHCGFQLSDGDEHMLFWGDMCHFASVQLARPELGVMFDVDRLAATRTRTDVLGRLASSGGRVAGAHLPFPGLGRVIQEGAAFRFVPEEWFLHSAPVAPRAVEMPR